MPAPEIGWRLVRVVWLPLAGLAHRHPEPVHAALDRAARRPSPGPLDGRFALAYRCDPGRLRDDAERALAAVLTRAAGPVALDELPGGRTAQAALARLVARGMVGLGGFTPTDAAHVLGRHAAWDATASRKGADLFLRRRDRRGMAHAPSAEAFAAAVLDLVVARSAAFVFETTAARDGLPGEGLAAHPLVRRAWSGGGGLVEARIRVTLPLVGLGAAAHLHYPAIADRLGTTAAIPAHAGVANAVGAVVGVVRRTAVTRITRLGSGVYRVHAGDGVADHADYVAARDAAETAARALVAQALERDGAADADIRVRVDECVAEAGGERILIETEIRAEGAGRPRHGVG
jgi:N-methylhydantoinase A/oxoprolinase/acetone carboxylase beta subunit